MTLREWKRARKAIWESMQGCTCKALYKQGGKIVRARRDELCTREAIRCDGRLRRWKKDADKLGPEPRPASPSGDQQEERGK